MFVVVLPSGAISMSAHVQAKPVWVAIGHFALVDNTSGRLKVTIFGRDGTGGLFIMVYRR